MCGLVGVAGNLFTADTNFFEQALFADQLRGHHSTGVFEVDSKSGDLTWYKKAVNASDFLQMHVANSLITTGAMLLAGHNRWATVGAHTDDNAHPFIHGDIALMHNGTLKSRRGLARKHFTVDSEHIAYTISQCEEEEDIVKVLEELDGAFALVWYNYKMGKLYMARNSERSLYVAYNKVGNIYWASEQKMLEWICSRKNVNLTVSGDELPVGELWSFDIDGKKSVAKTATSTKFTPYTYSPPSIYNYGRQGGGNRTHQAAATFLADNGVEVGDYLCFRVNSFKPFANDNRGTLEGVDPSTGTKVVVYSAKAADLIFKEDGALDLSVSYWAAILGASWPSSGGRAIRADADTLIETLEKTDDDKTSYLIDGEAFTKAEKKEIQSIGCSLCGGPFTDIDIYDAKKVPDTTSSSEFLHKGCLEEWEALVAEEEAYGNARH